MADTEGAEGDQDPEVAEEELDTEEAALLQISTYSEARHALPWEQRTFREKANFYLDRIFLGFLVCFTIVLLGECVYKMWYVTNVRKIAAFVSDVVVFLYDWLFTQEKQEEALEL